MSDEAKAALRKLVQALPRTFRTVADAAARATVIDPARWGEHARNRPGVTGDGRSLVRVSAPRPLDIARNLAGWGAMIEVTWPASVRAQLASRYTAGPARPAR